MSKSKEQLQQAVLDVGEQFAASMDTLLDTELRYLKYLRNRKRFHIGVRNIISNGLGSGKFPDDPKSTRTRRNPRKPGGGGVGVPIPVPIFVPEREQEEEEPTDVLVPEKITDRPDDTNPVIVVPEKINKDDEGDGGQEIEIPETDPFEIPIIVPPNPVTPPVEVPVPSNSNQVFDAPGDEIFNYEGLSDFFSFNVPQVNWPELNIDWATIGAGLGSLLLWPFKSLLGGRAAFGSEMDLSNIYSQPTETIIGEDGAEIVLPVDELGDLISLVYKDGAQVFIGTSQDFLSGLPSSPGKTAVLGDANRLAAIFGITDKGDGNSLSLGLENPITFSSTSTVEKEDLDLESIEQKSIKEASKGEGRVARRRRNKKKSFEEVKAEIDAKELAKQQRKANKRGSGAKPNPFSDASEQVKIPSDGNGEDRFGNAIILNDPTENAWQKAVRDAAGDGVDLSAGVNSSFRSPEQQQQLLELQDAGDPSVAQVAEIGASPHQQGWGLDIAIGTPAHQWMLQNGKKYNFDWAGPADPVHFNFINNESNLKYLEDLQPSGSRNNMERDLAPVPRDKKDLVSKKAKAKIGATAGALGGLGMMGKGNITPPNVQTDKEIVSNQPVNQLDKNSDLIATQPSMIPVPISTTVQVPVPMAQKETKEIRRTLIIDTFDKGARVEVAYV